MDVTSAIVQFCKQYCTQVKGIMVFGSYVEGEYTDKSDVDVIVLDDMEPEGKKIQTTIHSYRLQVTVMSFVDIVRSLQSASFTGDYFFPNIINRSSILFDDEGICQYLKHKADVIIKKGPPKIASNKKEASRIALSNYIHDGSNPKYTGSTLSEKMLWSGKTIIMCHEYLLMNNDDWRYTNSKLKRTVLKSHYKELYDALDKAHSDFHHHMDCEKFSINVKNIMASQMTFSWDTNAPNHGSVN